jgi:membrane fusion protein (multidrug efflux system)
MKKLAFRGLMAAIFLSGGIYGAVVFMNSLTHESTDDAFVSGTVVPIAAEVKGRVVKVYIQDNQCVTAGQQLFEISQDDYRNSFQERQDAVSILKEEERELRASIEQRRKLLDQVRANLNAVLEEERLASKEIKRYQALKAQEVVSQSQYDRVESQWRVASAHREAANASVDEAEAAIRALEVRLSTQVYKIREAETGRKMAELDLRRTVVRAPCGGRIAMKKVDPGRYVQPGQALLSIVRQDIWVTANFKETQIKKMRVGQPVKVKADAYPGVVFRGHVDSLQPGTGSVFTLLPPENASGNFVKVVQRIPVKIVVDSPFDPAHPLWPGLSVYPVVDVSIRP